MDPKAHIPAINLPGSKSISNRLLMIKAIGALDLSIENLSDSDDTQLLQKALDQIQNGDSTIDIHHAGTNMRFMCSFIAALPNRTITLTGSDRMRQRPIKELVDALIVLGADINYLEKEGYPPLKINGKKLNGGEIEVNASVSSQFITSLLLIAPYLQNGLRIKLIGETVSPSYIQLTIELMRSFGITIDINGDYITVEPARYVHISKTVFNESDWSAASYFYSAFLLSKFNKIELNGITKNSLQPDHKTAEIFELFGIKTEYLTHKICLHKTNTTIKHFEYNFIDCPDIAQTIAVTCVALGISASFKGLQTLKIKETDRILALKLELEKLGAKINASSNSLDIMRFETVSRQSPISIATYNDHRMAMSFAPLFFMFPNLTIDHKEVVSKSFPNFWSEFSKIFPVTN